MPPAGALQWSRRWRSALRRPEDTLSKARTRRRHREARKAKAARTAPRSKSRLAWKSWLGWGVTAIVVVGVAALLIRSPGHTTEDPTLATLARENSGGPVQVLTGTAHTVYHSTPALPTVAQPRADGRPTLVWFSGTWCEFCERMEPFAHSTAAGFRDRVVFVEKSVDHDRAAASRYGIRGTPTFVLIDAAGREIGRFHYQPSGSALTQIIEAALARTEA